MSPTEYQSAVRGHLISKGIDPDNIGSSGAPTRAELDELLEACGHVNR